MKIRKVLPKDRTQISLILEDTNAFTDEERACAIELLDIYLNNPAQKDYNFLCAADNNDIPIGYVCYGKAPFTDAAFNLYWIAVNPTFQGRGIGQELIAALEIELAKNDSRLLLIETSSKLSYANTRAFYEKNEFVELSRVKDFYRINDDRITYGKYYPVSKRTAADDNILKEQPVAGAI